MLRVIHNRNLHRSMTDPIKIIHKKICDLVVAEDPGRMFLDQNIPDHGTLDPKV